MQNIVKGCIKPNVQYAKRQKKSAVETAENIIQITIYRI